MELLEGSGEPIGYVSLFLLGGDGKDKVYVKRRKPGWIEQLLGEALGKTRRYDEIVVGGKEEYFAREMWERGYDVAFSVFVQSGKSMEEVFGEERISNGKRYFGRAEELMRIPVYAVVLLK